MLWVLYAVIGFGMFGTFLMMTAERMYEVWGNDEPGNETVDYAVCHFPGDAFDYLHRSNGWCAYCTAHHHLLFQQSGLFQW
jgi:hypothetical protein